MSDSSPGPGWWQASDGKWYPPELHPAVTEAAAREAPAPDTSAPARRWWVAGGGDDPKPLYRRAWFIALAAVVGLVVAVVVHPGNKTNTSGRGSAPPTTAGTQPATTATTAATATDATTLPSGASTTALAAGGASTCTATISNPTPSDGGAETIQVTSNLPNTDVTATIYYETTTSEYPGITNSSGSATIAFGVGQATVGDTVTITVIVGSGATCTTSFTPQ